MYVLGERLALVGYFFQNPNDPSAEPYELTGSKILKLLGQIEINVKDKYLGFPSGIFLSKTERSMIKAEYTHFSQMLRMACTLIDASSSKKSKVPQQLIFGLK